MRQDSVDLPDLSIHGLKEEDGVGEMALTPIAREIYDLLFEISDDGLTVQEIAQKTGKNPSQVRGALSWPTAHAKSYGRPSIHLQHPDGKVFVTALVAHIFKEALGRK